MQTRDALFLGLAANVIFWPALFLFAAARPDYSHLTDAVSELGVWGAPRMWAWNVIGFMLPFWLAAASGWGVGRIAAPRGWVLPGLFAASGVLAGLAGVFPADLSERQGFWTLAHLGCSQGGLLVWIVAMLMLGVRVRGPSRGLAMGALGWLVVTIGAVVLTYQPQYPALSQRVVFAGFLASFPLLAAIALFVRRSVTKTA